MLFYIIQAFGYNEGLLLLPVEGAVEYYSEDEGIEAAFDDASVADFEEEDKCEEAVLNGVGEYGYGFWSRWSRTAPKYLFPKAPWHSIARFTVNRNHGDIGFKDRTLATWLGVGFYHFATYSLPSEPNLSKNMPYNANLEGQWNYIYFGYQIKQKKALGYVFFTGNE
jgi:hypothetical protein